jgi:hypothetical protein
MVADSRVAMDAISPSLVEEPLPSVLAGIENVGLAVEYPV